MDVDKSLIKVYGLFRNIGMDGNSDYYAHHTLNRLFLDYHNSKEAKEIRKIASPFLSDYTIHPYLMLYRLSEDKAEEITGLIFNDIAKNLFPDKNFSKKIIERVYYPSLDMPFMKNLLNTITSKRRDERFEDPKKARELFLFYADKKHLGMVLDKLESYSQSYHEAMDDGGGLDFSDD